MTDDSNVPVHLKFDWNNHRTDVEIRTIDGEPLYKLAAVCRAIGHSNPRMAAKLLDKDEKILINVTTGAAVSLIYGAEINDLAGQYGNVFAWYITEPGLYHLLNGSDKPAAKAFQRWNNHTVLPTIRKTGSYGTGAAPDNALLTSQIKTLIDAVSHLSHRLEAIERPVNQHEAERNPKWRGVEDFMDTHELLIERGIISARKVRGEPRLPGSIAPSSHGRLSGQIGDGFIRWCPEIHRSEWIKLGTGRGAVRQFLASELRRFMKIGGGEGIITAYRMKAEQKAAETNKIPRYQPSLPFQMPRIVPKEAS